MIERCLCCGKVLDPNKIKWLELSTNTGLYTDSDVVKVPEEESQGFFAFGITCAAKVVKRGGQCECHKNWYKVK